MPGGGQRSPGGLLARPLESPRIPSGSIGIGEHSPCPLPTSYRTDGTHPAQLSKLGEGTGRGGGQPAPPGACSREGRDQAVTRSPTGHWGDPQYKGSSPSTTQGPSRPSGPKTLSPETDPNTRDIQTQTQCSGAGQGKGKTGFTRAPWQGRAPALGTDPPQTRVTKGQEVLEPSQKPSCPRVTGAAGVQAPTPGLLPGALQGLSCLVLG